MQKSLNANKSKSPYKADEDRHNRINQKIKYPPTNTEIKQD